MATYALHDISVLDFSGNRNSEYKVAPPPAEQTVNTSISISSSVPQMDVHLLLFTADVTVQTINANLQFTLGVTFKYSSDDDIPDTPAKEQQFIKDTLHPAIFPYVRQYVHYFSVPLRKNPITLPLSLPANAISTPNQMNKL
ncbi:hypothetical protein [Arcanobacterium buesumense]|uniref:Preprotein translocase subunit SecB n=1 Tax=Arcanobacterium buesumense TaxID=2722751 RepID=A0A6H2EKB9_9ACTO|nr:hypothetical protein [Arcanobacterium buesumense]QJC21127.1 hypothetical protein HC352_00405 [Arcanobacterium buesumense]